jgi:hypothetical protein
MKMPPFLTFDRNIDPRYGPPDSYWINQLPNLTSLHAMDTEEADLRSLPLIASPWLAVLDLRDCRKVTGLEVAQLRSINTLQERIRH